MWIKRAIYETLVRNNAAFEKWAHGLLASEQRLLDRIDELKAALVAERKRSDTAIDRLLNTKGVSGIVPAEKVDLEELTSMFEESPEEIAAVRKAILDQGIEEVLLGEAQ
jgi:hypothetical protein